MPRRKNNPLPQPRRGELPEEFQLRRTLAKLQLRHAKAALATYAAADKGRRNRDWRANNASADLAIIPDQPTLLGRARQMVRDNWVAKSIVRAYVRNIVGKGITVSPHAKDADGAPLTELNRVAQAEFVRWAKSKACDVERKQTFVQKQRLAVRERATVGEHLVVWSYRMPTTYDGRVDRTQPVGLALQSFEPEQFDLRIQSFEGREVRGGVEVDEGGAAIAYHLYTRNPNDYLYRHAFFSKRMARERCLHYFDQERVLQTHGVTPMSPVLQDMRDLASNKDATMMRVRMEACIGAVIRQPAPNSTGGFGTTILPRQAGDNGATPSGMRTLDFVPGMTAQLLPGEEVDFLTPQSPGNQYEPFTNLTVRGIGAGAGMSFGQVMRQSDGNYSSARQDMLEDRKEWEPEQELLIDDIIRPLYEIWFNFAALEGRFDGVPGFDMGEYVNDRHRFVEADFTPPAASWIDPEKEANAFAKLLELRVITREEIAAMAGRRFHHTVAKLASEKAETADLGLTLPEDENDRKDFFDALKAMLSDKQGTLANVIANNIDVREFLESIGFQLRPGVVTPLLPVVAPQAPLVNGDEVTDPQGNVIGGDIDAPPAPAGIPAQTGIAPPKEAMPAEAMMAALAAVSTTPGLARQVLAHVHDFGPVGPLKIARKFGHDSKRVSGVLSDLEAGGLVLKTDRGYRVTPKGKRQAHATLSAVAPNTVPAPAASNHPPRYRVAEIPSVNCGSCSWNVGGHCTRFDVDVDDDHVCDAWQALPMGPDTPGDTAKVSGPYKQDGERELDRQFFPDADTTPRP